MAIGKISPFNLTNDNWELYIDRLDQYFIVNSVRPDLKVATLITVIGSEAYELMVNLCTPEKPASKTYYDLTQLMQNHLSPKPSQLAERYRFRQRMQRPKECVSAYVAELKRLIMNCGYKDSLAENLRDQFICGLRNDFTRKKLFTEVGSVSLTKAYTIALAMETAENAAWIIDSSSSSDVPSTDASSACKLCKSERRLMLQRNICIIEDIEDGYSQDIDSLGSVSDELDYVVANYMAWCSHGNKSSSGSE